MKTQLNLDQRISVKLQEGYGQHAGTYRAKIVAFENDGRIWVEFGSSKPRPMLFTTLVKQEQIS